MTETRLEIGSKARLALTIWLTFLVVQFHLRRWVLAKAVARLGSGRSWDGWRQDPAHLGRLVGRLLGIGRLKARCLTRSLVLFRLLRRSGLAVDLVIGIPWVPQSTDAHAWVELHGRDLGPPPGRDGHEELARYR